MEIFLFGDSITYGAWDHNGGWAARLRAFVDEKILSSSDEDEYYHHIYNLGISGDRTSYLLERFESEIRARLRRKPDCAVVFAIGANDSQFSNVDKTFSVPIEVFEGNLNELIRLAKTYTSRIACVGLLPCDDAKMDPIPWRPENSYKTEYLREFDRVVARVCNKQGIPFVDVFDVFTSNNHVALLEDGIHPNDEGHAFVFKHVRDKLLKLGWI